MIKKFLQILIKKNYDKRFYKKIPDKWYWADKLYLKWYGDYSFYTFPDGWKL